MTGKGRDTFGKSQGPSCSKASYQFGKHRFEPMEGDQTVADKLCKRLVTKEMNRPEDGASVQEHRVQQSKRRTGKKVYTDELFIKRVASLCYEAAKQQYDHL